MLITVVTSRTHVTHIWKYRKEQECASSAAMSSFLVRSTSLYFSIYFSPRRFGDIFQGVFLLVIIDIWTDVTYRFPGFLMHFANSPFPSRFHTHPLASTAGTAFVRRYSTVLTGHAHPFFSAPFSRRPTRSPGTKLLPSSTAIVFAGGEWAVANRSDKKQDPRPEQPLW